VRLLLLVAFPLMAGGLAVDLFGQWQTGLRPEEHSYGAVVYTVIGVQGVYVVALTLMAFYTIARSLAGMLDGVRRVTFDNTMLFWHYMTAQGLVGLAVIHFFPRLIG